MTTLLIGLAAVALFIILIYLLGLLPNLWSSNIIKPSSLEDVFDRGVRVLVILALIAAVLSVINGIGMWIVKSINL